jgi:hypothetical protein
MVNELKTILEEGDELPSGANEENKMMFEIYFPEGYNPKDYGIQSWQFNPDKHGDVITIGFVLIRDLDD